MDAGARGLGALVDHVLHLLDVDARLADGVEDVGEHAGPIEVSDRKQFGRGRGGGAVDAVGGLAGRVEDLDDADGLGGDRVLGLIGRGADVVRAVDAGQRDDGIRELAGRARGLLREDVEAGADLLVAHRGGEGLLVADRAAARVDEGRAVLEEREELLADQLLGVGRRGDVHRDDVGELRDVEEVRAPAHARLGGLRLGEVAAPRDDRHAEGLRSLGDLAGDLPEADEPERAARETLGLLVLLLVPRARAELRGLVGHAAVAGEDQRPGQLRHRDRVLAGAVADEDAAAARGGDVDVVVAGARADDQFKRLARIDRIGLHLGRADHEDLRLEVRDRRRQRLRREVGVDRDREAAGLERCDAGGLELVGDQHAERCGLARVVRGGGVGHGGGGGHGSSRAWRWESLRPSRSRAPARTRGRRARFEAWARTRCSWAA